MIWKDTIKIMLYAHHQNFIGTKWYEELHSHLWDLTIEASHTKLDKNDVLFNYKTISTFISETFEDKNLNEILENREKKFSKKLLPYIKDIPNNPTNEVLVALFSGLVKGIIVTNDKSMVGIKVKASLEKEDRMKENYLMKKEENLPIIVYTKAECED